jgi:hypothetical protein
MPSILMSAEAAAALLDVRDLGVRFGTPGGDVEAVAEGRSKQAAQQTAAAEALATIEAMPDEPVSTEAGGDGLGAPDPAPAESPAT